MMRWLEQIVCDVERKLFQRLERRITQILDLEVSIMSVLSEKIAELGVKVDEAIAREGAEDAATAAEKESMQAEINRLQALVDAGGATQADLDALEALKVKIESINPA